MEEERHVGDTLFFVGEEDFRQGGNVCVPTVGVLSAAGINSAYSVVALPPLLARSAA